MSYAFSCGTKIYWEEHGSGEPILLVMGLSFTLDMWFRLLPCIAKNHRVILFDNRGVGRSEVPRGPYSIGQMAEDAFAVMDAAGVARAHVMGASMGGMIAQEMALRHPERIETLMLGCTSVGGLLSKWPEFRHFPRGVKWTQLTPEQREWATAPLLYADTTPQERIAEDVAVRLRHERNMRGLVGQAAAVVFWTSLPRLSQIRIPTIVVHGDQDRLVPAENGRKIAARIPGAEFVLIKNAGHVLTTDQPDACARVLMDFLDRHQQRKEQDFACALSPAGN